MNGFHRIEMAMLLNFMAVMGLNFLSSEVKPYWLVIIALFFIFDAVFGTTWHDDPDEDVFARLGANLGLLAGFSFVSLIVWGAEHLFNPFLCLSIFGLDTLGAVAFSSLIHSESDQTLPVQCDAAG